MALLRALCPRRFCLQVLLPEEISLKDILLLECLQTPSNTCSKASTLLVLYHAESSSEKGGLNH